MVHERRPLRARAVRPLIPLPLAVLILALPAEAQQATEDEPPGLRLPSSESLQTPAEPQEEERRKVRRFRWDDHPTLYLARRTLIDFRLRVQGTARESDALPGEALEFDMTRRRIGVQGRIAGLVDFEVDRELEHDEPWRDVYVNYRQFDHVQIQAGQFKLPFSLDENTSPTNLDFVYRSRAATQLAPGRDRGALVHGRFLNRAFRYELGLFDHDGRNARTRNPERVFGDRTVAGRLRVQPFRSAKSPLSDLQLGMAFTRSEVPEGFPALRGRTALDAAFFPSNVWVSGPRRRLGLEARWRPGPLSVKSELIRVTTERRGQSVENTDLSALVATGWYASGTWVLTGEPKASGLHRPRRSLFRGGAGAIEVAARIERLTFGSAASGELPSTSPRADVVLGNSYRAATFGVNWYPVRGIKLQGNIIRESLADPSRGPLQSRRDFWSRVVRLQFTI